MDDEMSAWSADWKAGDDRLSIARSEVVREGRKLVFGMVIEVLASLFVVAFWAVVLWRNPSDTNLLLGGASVLFVAIWLAFLAQNFRGTLAVGGTTAEYVAVSRRRLEAHVRWGAFSQVCAYGFGAFIVAWAAWFAAAAEASVPALRAIAPGLIGIYAILFGVWFFARRKVARTREELRRLAAVERG